MTKNTLDQNPRDMSRASFAFSIIGCVLLAITAMIASSWYMASLVQYPPDRSLVPQEVDQCLEAQAKGWPQSPYCKYR